MEDVTDRQVQIAQHRWEVGDTAGAIAALRALLAESPDHAVAHAMLGGVLLDDRRIHAALHEVELALAIEPDLYFARFLHAQVLVAHRRFDEGQAALAELIAEVPDDPALYRALGDALALRGEGGGEARRALLAKALELDPDSAATLADCADFHLARGELADAERMATRALTASPEHVQSLWVMGEVLLRTGRIDAAREHAAWILSRNAEHRGALMLLAKIKARRSPVLGLWWRFVSWVTLGGEARAIVILLAMYVGYRLVSLTLKLDGYATAYTVVNLAWLAFVLYCLVAPVAFRKALRSELDAVTLKRDF